MAIRVFITDNPSVVRQGLRRFLSLNPELEVVGEAESSQKAVAMARELVEPDLILMDLSWHTRPSPPGTRQKIRSNNPLERLNKR